MNQHVWLYYDGWGILLLCIFAACYGLSHVLWFIHLRHLDYVLKVVGFCALVALFIVSGWRAGLVGLPIGFVASSMVLIPLRPWINSQELSRNRSAMFLRLY
jgi:hypothetical protein